MNQQEADIHQIEITIENAEKSVKLMESYRRLIDNKDFKHLIEDTYFLTHASRLVLLRGDTNIPPETQENILREIDAVGFFRTFLRDVVQAGHQAKGAIEQCEETREEILSEVN